MEALEYQKKKNTTCIMRYYEPDVNKLHKTGVAEVDEEDRIISMEEKPANPKSHWCTPPFYIYKAEDVSLVKKGIERSICLLVSTAQARGNSSAIDLNI